MSITALGPYEFKSRDAVENYKGKQLMYVNWEKHRMFSRPFVIAVEPSLKFSELIEKFVTPAYEFHPDFAQIDWSKVVWQNSNTPFTPQLDKSLAENGVGHKDLIRFTTPGLDGLNGIGY
ncbi:MAG: phenol hydroxylase subunit P4 [Betaproteobacteria bacterium]|nr:phenol hydroxylase subunit P4 [Betaproteobacteria bacterium]